MHSLYPPPVTPLGEYKLLSATKEHVNIDVYAQSMPSKQKSQFDVCYSPFMPVVGYQGIRVCLNSRKPNIARPGVRALRQTGCNACSSKRWVKMNVTEEKPSALLDKFATVLPGGIKSEFKQQYCVVISISLGGQPQWLYSP